MKKFIPTALLGVAGATVIGLLGMQAPAVQAGPADEALKREDGAVELVPVADDDDDDTNDDDDGDDGDTNSRSRETNDNTASNFTGVSRDRDNSRGDKTRDWTRDGAGDKKRDWSANQTNDRSRNDTRR
ncbi:hypothetical protein [Nocardioides sp. B-3]|uniref:hypothetical protein n=1 Tax=Nocardioides sp. B-3 TaxID=2895565 RepID=UPI00215283FA|nr:hypothetical protein [Nocardioides sp. B-3]UUZ58611.1 hypothetical protein LP418_21075 [Nocardioides sp. B-3]